VRLDFFDCNLCLGQPAKGGYRVARTGEELGEQVSELGIVRGIAWHIAQYDCSAQAGNALLSRAIAGDETLLGCWSILPPQTREVLDETFFQRMAADRITAMRAFPDRHRYILSRVVFGDFLDEVSLRRIPLLLSPEKGATWEQIYGLLSEYPDLTCILYDTGVWGVDRYTWPLLERYANVFLETSMLCLEACGLEATVHRFGAKRLLFGSGFPERYPEAAVMALMHADISPEDKSGIASANLERLISGVRL
jgi:uncharacterized protein